MNGQWRRVWNRFFIRVELRAFQHMATLAVARRWARCLSYPLIIQHTIFGRQGLSGISLLAAQAFLRVIDLANKDRDVASPRLGLGMKLFEMRNKTACDLLNDRTECFVREGPDGKTHIRGATEMLEGGKVRVKPIRTVTCWTWEELDQTLKYGLAQRTSGTSTIHDESSRTHAILQLEVISDTLLRARENVTEKEAELVPVGKDATGVYLEEHGRAWTRDAAGNIQRNPEYTIDQARIDAAEALKAEYQERLDKAIQDVEAILAVPSYPRLGARLVFVDLAGAEFNDDRAGSDRTFQTAEERRATRQINTDLMALKEVMRAHASRQKRIPFRGSPLTMVLREHFAGDDHASMIATVSSDGEQYPATLNTVRFASLVGAAA